ncbi:MAG TPA: DUF4340 domain-containing protein [Pirellulales bacterium]|nr:DUF4340 domain-containing protein [Pirellulales bacterium]
MNENVKTLTFVGVAVVAVAIGGWANFASSSYETEAVGTGPLFPNFEDPLTAKSLEIISFDQDTATLTPFKVAQVKGRWSIPSHEGYPADAAKQLGEAAANMIEAKRLNVASEDPSTYEEYGVVEPNAKTLEVGSTGVGKRITMQDKSNKTLADLIIGKQVEGQADQHYVRIPDQTPVYVASIKTDKFSTKFEDWIEKDLLKLNPLELKQVAINDYSIDELRGAINPRSQVSVEYDDKELKWRLLELAEFTGEEFEPVKLADDEELNSQKLNDLKTAVDDLKIVDVRRKPAGLAADLKAGEELAAKKEVINALAARGFHLARVKDGPTEIYSNEGEVRVGMKDGVEYTLRFGRIAAGPTGDEAEEKEEGEEGEAKAATGANRYIMVTAQFNPELLPPPELQPLPDEQPATEEAGEGEGNGEEKKASDKAQADAKADDAKKKAERERIEKENKRLLDDHEAKVKKGEERNKELSDRFADWYYVISDATYQKIHLGRDAIVQKKTPPAGETGKEGSDTEASEGKENILTDELRKGLK